MSDPDAKRWLADDEDFIATLGDLDRGLTGRRESGDPPANGPSPSAATPDQPAPPSSEPQPGAETPARRETPARSGGAASPLATAFVRPAAGDPQLPRRLLNLFPESALEPERPAESSGSVPSTTAEDRSAARERVTGELLAAIGARGGPAVLIAPAGWGKTTFCRTLLKELDRRTVASLVIDPLQSLDDLLRRMLVDFGVMAPDLGGSANLARPVLTSALNAFLQSLEQLHAGAVVVIDDAHTVPVDVFVDLAALLAPGTPGARVLQLVLAGESPLAAALKRPELRDFDARIVHRAQFGDPGAEADRRPRPEPAAVAPEATPRLSPPPAVGPVNDDVDIADLFDESVELPSARPLHDPAPSIRRRSTATFDTPTLEAEADPTREEDDQPRGVSKLLIATAFALLVFAGARGALWVWRDAVARTILQWESIPAAPAAPTPLLPEPIAPAPPPPAGIAGNLR